MKTALSSQSSAHTKRVPHFSRVCCAKNGAFLGTADGPEALVDTMRFSHQSLNRFAQCSCAFGAPLHGGIAAGAAACYRFLAALAQPALKCIPASADAYRAIADYHRVGSGGDQSLR